MCAARDIEEEDDVKIVEKDEIDSEANKKSLQKRAEALCQEVFSMSLEKLNEKWLADPRRLRVIGNRPLGTCLIDKANVQNFEDVELIDLLNKTKPPLKQKKKEGNIENQLFLRIELGMPYPTTFPKKQLKQLKAFKKKIQDDDDDDDNARIVVLLGLDVCSMSYEYRLYKLSQKFLELQGRVPFDIMQSAIRPVWGYHDILMINYPKKNEKQWIVYDNGGWCESPEDSENLKKLFTDIYQNSLFRAARALNNHEITRAQIFEYSPDRDVYDIARIDATYIKSVQETLNILGLNDPELIIPKINFIQDVQNFRDYDGTCITITWWRAYFLWYTHNFYNDIPPDVPKNEAHLFAIFMHGCYTMNKIPTTAPEMFKRALHTNMLRQLASVVLSDLDEATKQKLENERRRIEEAQREKIEKREKAKQKRERAQIMEIDDEGNPDFIMEINDDDDDDGDFEKPQTKRRRN